MKDKNNKNSSAVCVRTVKLTDAYYENRRTWIKGETKAIKLACEHETNEDALKQFEEMRKDKEAGLAALINDPNVCTKSNARVKYFDNARNNPNLHAYKDSELFRIIRKIEERMVKTGEESGCSNNSPDLRSLLIVDVNSVEKYKTIMKNDGVLELLHFEYVGEQDSAEEDDDEQASQKVRFLGDEKTERFKRLICGSSHARKKRAVFVREELYDAVNKILLGGIENPDAFVDCRNVKKSLAKWNAYYALASTDSTPVTAPEKIIVIKDYELPVETKCDVVTTEKNDDGTVYSLCSDRDYTINSNCFDGAGLVSVAMAKQWAKELGVLDEEEEGYIPASFQIRAIPGIKGNVYTFDIAKFAREKNGDKFVIVDTDGNEVEFGEDDNVVILTESQVKFRRLLTGTDNLHDLFETEIEVEVNGEKITYKRTFNISEFSVSTGEVKENYLTAYQHLQTLDIRDNDADDLREPTSEQIREISSDIPGFLEYKSQLDLSDFGLDDDPDDSAANAVKFFIPPYYKAALTLAKKTAKEGGNISSTLSECFADDYFCGKMQTDIELRIKAAHAGKLTVTGNYQVFTPDLYALCQHAFGQEVTGLLQGDEIYSAWWLTYDAYFKATAGENYRPIGKLAITRNPHIYMESRVVGLAADEDKSRGLDEWFKYQETGIMISIYSHVPYALGTADFDGDTVATTNDCVIIAAIEQAINDGSGNTIYHPEKPLSEKEKAALGSSDLEVTAKTAKERENEKKPADIPKEEQLPSNVKALMESDLAAFGNNIGKVVNLITKIWNLGEEDCLEYFGLPKIEEEFGGVKHIYYRFINPSEEFRKELVKTTETKYADEAEKLGDLFNYLIFRRSYLKIMSVVGQLTLDAAKTGETVKIPDEIPYFLEKYFKGEVPGFLRDREKSAKSKKSDNGKLTLPSVNTTISRVCGAVIDAHEEDYRETLNREFGFGIVMDEVDENGRGIYREMTDKEVRQAVDFAEDARDSWRANYSVEKFKEAVRVGKVDRESPLYKAAEKALSAACKLVGQLKREFDKISDAGDRRTQYAYLYKENLKPTLLSLNVIDEDGELLSGKLESGATVGELIDCYITAAYKSEGKTAQKDVLWNCFGNEISERIKSGRTKADDKRVVLSSAKPPLRFTNPKGRSAGMCELAKIKTGVAFFEKDVKFIRQCVDKAYPKADDKTKERMLRFCAALVVVTKDRRGQKEAGFLPSESKPKPFARRCMCLEDVKEVDTVSKHITSREKFQDNLNILTKAGFLEAVDGRCSVKLPKIAKTAKALFVAIASDDPFQKATDAVLSED